MIDPIDSRTDACGLRIAVVVSRYHDEITTALEAGAIGRFTESGGREADLLVLSAAGAFELTAICQAVATHRRPDAIVAVGCVITGQTKHDRFIAESIVHGITEITVRTGVPVAFGVLTCASREQALARAGGAIGNKGEEAMAAAIATAHTIRRLAGTELPQERR